MVVLQSAELKKLNVITPAGEFLTDILTKFNGVVHVCLAFVDTKKPALCIPGACLRTLPYQTNEDYCVNEIVLDQPSPVEYQTMLKLIWETTKKVQEFIGASTRPLTVIAEDGGFHSLDFNQVICKLEKTKFRCYLRYLAHDSAVFFIHIEDSAPEKETEGLIVLKFKNIRYFIEIPGVIHSVTWYDESIKILEVVFNFTRKKVPISYYNFLEKTTQTLRMQLCGQSGYGTSI